MTGHDHSTHTKKYKKYDNESLQYVRFEKHFMKLTTKIRLKYNNHSPTLTTPNHYLQFKFLWDVLLLLAVDILLYIRLTLRYVGAAGGRGFVTLVGM